MILTGFKHISVCFVKFLIMATPGFSECLRLDLSFQTLFSLEMLWKDFLFCFEFIFNFVCLKDIQSCFKIVLWSGIIIRLFLTKEWSHWVFILEASEDLAVSFCFFVSLEVFAPWIILTLFVSEGFNSFNLNWIGMFFSIFGFKFSLYTACFQDWNNGSFG